MHLPRLLVLDRGDGLYFQTCDIAGELWPVPEVVSWTVPGTVGDVLTDEGPFDLLIAGPSLGTRNGLTRLRIIREELPAMAIVLAFSRRPDASIRDIVRSGAVDLVQLPATDADLLAAIEQALPLSLVASRPEGDATAATYADRDLWQDTPLPGMEAHPSTEPPPLGEADATGWADTEPPSAPRQAHAGEEPADEPVTAAHIQPAASLARPPAPPAPESPGRVVTIASAARGCGKTFLATNVACFLAQHSAGRVCIVDLDLHFGGVTHTLGLSPAHTIADALYDADAEEIDLAADLVAYMVGHRSGVAVLAAPADPAEADDIRPQDVATVVEAAREHFEWVVVDTPPTLSEVVLAAFDTSDELYATAALDMAALRELNVFLSTLQRLGVANDDVRLILNKADPAAEADVEEITRLFPRGFDAVLPISEEVPRSIADGMPVLADAPASEISRLLTRGLRRLLPDGAQEAPVLGAYEPRQPKRRRISLRR